MQNLKQVLTVRLKVINYVLKMFLACELILVSLTMK